MIVQEDDLLQNTLFLAQVDVEHLIEQVEDYVLDVLAGKRCESCIEWKQFHWATMMTMARTLMF